MIEGDYEYRGLIARSWDFLRGDTSDFPDRQFYRDIVNRSGEPVLIVGCGTGRLLLEYLGDGLDVEGVDVSPEMLEICKQKAIQQSLRATVYLQAMETMDLPRQFRTIIVPSSSFQLVPDLAEAESTLEGFFRHLLPGARLSCLYGISKAMEKENGVIGGRSQKEMGLKTERPSSVGNDRCMIQITISAIPKTDMSWWRMGRLFSRRCIADLPKCEITH
jgi:SAM-dependent methyltransferase